MSVDPLLQSVLDMMSGDMFLPAKVNDAFNAAINESVSGVRGVGAVIITTDGENIEVNEVRDLFYGEEE